jgi:hypothetical protein
MVTDYVLAALTVFFAARLFRSRGQQGHRSVALWTAALVLIGVAAVTGGSWHGFRLMWPDMLADAVWKVTLLAIGLGSYCFFAGALFAALGGGWRRVLLAAAGVQLVIYIWWITGHDDFKYAIYNYTPSMVGVLVLQLYVLVKRIGAGAKWVIAGIMVSSVGAGIQTMRLSIHEYFTNSDAYHVIQMAGVYYFYRGGLHFKDRS